MPRWLRLALLTVLMFTLGAPLHATAEPGDGGRFLHIIRQPPWSLRRPSSTPSSSAEKWSPRDLSPYRHPLRPVPNSRLWRPRFQVTARRCVSS